jgi:hypothetical protein
MSTLSALSRVGFVSIALIAHAAAHAEVTCIDENEAIPASTDGAFIALPDGTVFDSRTALIWDRCTLGQDHNDDCSGDFGDVFDWHDALLEVQARNAAQHLGHSDWRLPNVKEGGTITERRCQSPSIDQAFFPNTTNDPAYWTSTTHPAVPNTAWVVHFAVGLYAGPFNKNLMHRVRLVRGGQPTDQYDSHLIFADGFDTPPES